MRDLGRSDDLRVQAQLDRLGSLSIQRDTLGLEAVRTLLSRLGDPHMRLPPVFHVAGTNGKGSTCAFLRAMLEAEGKRVHVTTSPHLVRYNERIRIAGKLIDDTRLAALLEEVFNAAEGLGCSFFEVTIAAAFAEFARVPADACVVEVGLGGRLDATNVLTPEVLAACGIAALGIDHERFLLAPEDGVPKQPMARIAFEKAGIAKRSVPLVTMGNNYPPEASAAVRDVADAAGAKLFEWGTDWDLLPDTAALAGQHQRENAGLAIAMIKSQRRVKVGEAAIAEGLRAADWPARLQRLAPGPLAALAPGHEIVLDGAHNMNAGKAVAESFDGPVHLVTGMLDNKDPRALLDPFAGRLKSLTVVNVTGHDAHNVEAFGPNAITAIDLKDALAKVPADGIPILIAGSLYLAGEALKFNQEIPD